ncbi:MAG: barstar family protein [Planctomycetota bacterium]
MMILDLDVSNIATSEDLQVLLESLLGLPGHYGRNWNAYWDCIRDPEQSAMRTFCE